MNKNRIIAITLTFFAVLITLFIFANSSKVAEESKQQSEGITEAIVEAADGCGVKLDSESVSFFIRKAAHFGEYFILAAVISSAIALMSVNKKLIFLSSVCCFAVALCDEFVVQSATAGRSPEMRDCIIDLCGALLAALTVYIIKKKRG